MPIKTSKIKIQKSKVKKVSKVSKVTRNSSYPELGSGSIKKMPKQVRHDKKEVSRVNLSVPLYSLAGRETGTLLLPKEIFGQKVNKVLLAQAVRVYATNQKYLPGKTLGRGEVEGSTAKIYRQKGTGRARHGAVRAPIFVGGGIVFGPKPRKVRLSLPQKMKKNALLSALSAKVLDKKVIGISGLEKASGKTKELAKLIEKINSKSGLLMVGDKSDNVKRAIRNIPDFNALPANLLNAYEVLKHDVLMVSKEALEKLKV